MIINVQEQEDKQSLIPEYKWDLAFSTKSLDQRGIEAIQFLNENSLENYDIEYDPQEMELIINEERINIDKVDDKLNFLKEKKIVVDATTLSFAEILIITKFTITNNIWLDILYLEPKSYSRKRTEVLGKLHSREFELSMVTAGFIPIPGYTNSLYGDGKRKTIFMAGYESERIERCIQENSLRGKDCSLIFGVPAFKVGWEMNSFANNIHIIKSHHVQNIHYSGANNPCSTLDLLYWIHDSLEDDEELYIAPVGPKPAGIATAIFASQKKNVNIFYDHPKKKKVRSKEIGKWHLYTLRHNE